jgi:HEPN domain-containing protein
MTETENIKQMFNIAADDLEVAKMAFEKMYPKKLGISSFHCQQCAEKSLKAYLLCKRIEFPFVHDLKTLCKLCITADDTFKTILDISASLTLYGVVSRYPREIIITEDIAMANIRKAQTIYDFCLPKIIYPSEGSSA